jgi:hypothetical protein
MVLGAIGVVTRFRLPRSHAICTPAVSRHDMLGAFNVNVCPQDRSKRGEFLATQPRTRRGGNTDGTVVFAQQE